MKPDGNVVDNKEAMGKYQDTTFNETGYDKLLNHTKVLTELFFKRKEEEYPFKIGVVLGMPFFHWANEISDKKELENRIKSYMGLLGISSVEVNVGGSQLKLEFKSKERGETLG